jgi:DNA-binding PadR family transcriptional regulator
MRRKDWHFGFEKLFGDPGFEPFGRFDWRGGGPRRGRGRRQFFESGEMKYVILRLLREKPRHGYEIIKALEEKTGGCYSPSAGTIYPTLQLLEDQGLVRIVESDGKKVYHLTADGERFLDENAGTIDDIADRLRDAVHGVAGGEMGSVHQAFARVAQQAYKTAWRNGPDSETTRKVAEILKRAADEIAAL